MMKALAFTYHKGDVEVVETKRPTPSAKEIQVKVEYSAMDTGFDDVIDRTWTGMFIHKFTKPLFLGWHYSGKVTAVGNEVENYKVGDAVFGHLPHAPGTAQGSLAEYITVDQTSKRPENVESKIAAASATEAMTALQALRDYGKMKADGQASVLIIGGAGGVGSAAVQIARAMGAHVTAVCSTRDVERVQDYGAQKVLDRKDYPDPLMYEGSYDVIFDTPVVLSPKKALTRLKKNGHYIATLPSWGLLWCLMSTMFSSKGVHMVEVQPRSEDFAIIAEYLATGKLKIPIDSTYKIKDTPEAQKRQSGRKNGRVVIKVENGWY